VHVNGSDGENKMTIRLNVYEKARTVTSVCTSGTLCTISSHEGIDGSPFGSFVDYVLDDDGNPVFLMNEMSMHTINIKNAQQRMKDDNNPAAMVTLFTQLGGNTNNNNDGPSFGPGSSSNLGNKGLQDVSRCSLTGRLEKLTADAADMDALRMRYSITHVYADQVMDSPKFAFYRLIPDKIYFVGGFGVLSTWVDPEDYKNANPDILATQAAGICARINRDHDEDLRLTAQHLLNIAPKNADAIESVRVTTVDRLGMDLRVTAQQGTRRNKLQTDEFRIGFRIPVQSVEDAKSEILKIFQEAWEKGNGVEWGDSEVPGESVPIMKIAADSLE
jgi:putative heme iron utilization protein